MPSWTKTDANNNIVYVDCGPLIIITVILYRNGWITEFVKINKMPHL